MAFSRIAISFFSLCSPIFLFGQSELTSFTVTGRGGVATTFVTDYHAIGINPANLGWANRFEGKNFTIGLAEGSYSVFAEALRRKEVRQRLEFFGGDKFSWEEKKAAARDFAENGFAVNLDFMSLGAAFTSETFGGLAFNIRDRFRSYINLSSTASDILFRGYNADYFDRKFDGEGNELSGNYDPDSVRYAKVSDSLQRTLSEITQGTRMDLSWYREFNLSYGKGLLTSDPLSLYVGGGVKYIRGYALMKVRSTEADGLTAFSATTPAFDIDYGEKAVASNPTADTTNSGSLPDAVGEGFGFDLGGNMVIGKKLKLGVAVNNIGAITWSGNVYEVRDTIVHDTESPGANNYDLSEGLEGISGDSGVFRWAGKKKERTPLPAVARFGTSYEIVDAFEIGGDLVVPLNDAPGSYKRSIYGVGFKLELLKWLELSGGVKSNAYGNVVNVPVGLVLRSPAGSYEAGIASRDAVTFFTQDQPTISLSTGFLRFRF